MMDGGVKTEGTRRTMQSIKEGEEKAKRERRGGVEGVENRAKDGSRKVVRWRAGGLTMSRTSSPLRVEVDLRLSKSGGVGRSEE